MAIRIQRSRARGWRMPEGAVYVGRPSRWSNPFAVETVGRELAIDLFRDAMDGLFDPFKIQHLTDDEFGVVYAAKDRWHKRLNCGAELRSAARHELDGKTLVCWCRLDQPCHADVLLEIANAPLRCDTPPPQPACQAGSARGG